jgi:hypothetical protein
MGFGFNLIGFPILILATVGLLIYFLVSQKKIALRILGGLLGLTILVFILGRIADHYRTPIRLTKHDIVGEYRIDTTFFPGTNANWQYNHYKFYITDKDSILFVVMKENEIPRTFYKHRIKYSDGPPDLWSIVANSTHHVIKNQPTLYRGHDKFYYVFHSDKFGNMFFRKLEK